MPPDDEEPAWMWESSPLTRDNGRLLLSQLEQANAADRAASEPLTWDSLRESFQRLESAPLQPILTAEQMADLRFDEARNRLAEALGEEPKGIYAEEIAKVREFHRKEREKRLSFPTLWDHILETP